MLANPHSTGTCIVETLCPSVDLHPRGTHLRRATDQSARDLTLLPVERAFLSIDLWFWEPLSAARSTYVLPTNHRRELPVLCSFRGNVSHSTSIKVIITNHTGLHLNSLQNFRNYTRPLLRQTFKPFSRKLKVQKSRLAL